MKAEQYIDREKITSSPLAVRDIFALSLTCDHTTWNWPAELQLALLKGMRSKLPMSGFLTRGLPANGASAAGMKPRSRSGAAYGMIVESQTWTVGLVEHRVENHVCSPRVQQLGTMHYS